MSLCLLVFTRESARLWPGKTMARQCPMSWRNTRDYWLAKFRLLPQADGTRTAVRACVAPARGRFSGAWASGQPKQSAAR